MDAVILHSGGMDSSICLALAIKKFGASQVLSLGFDYGQRHDVELVQSAKICNDWGVERVVLPIPFYTQITENALLNHLLPIQHLRGQPPNTLVVGRNGLMAQIGAVLAHHLGAYCLYMGIMELESANSGYRDCSRAYMDKVQELIRLDLDSSHFEICTPLVQMTKKETLEIAFQLGLLDYLLEETVTCYEGIRHQGCQKCPSCLLRNQGIAEFTAAH